MKILSILLILSFTSTGLQAQEYSKAEECELLMSDLVEAYDDLLTPLFLKHEKTNSELIKLESSLREAVESEDKNTRRVVIAVAAGVASVTLGYFALRNIKSAVPTTVFDVVNPTTMPLYWRIILGAGSIGSGGYAAVQTRDFFLTKKQAKEALAAVESAQVEFEKVDQELDEKMCEANSLIKKELKNNQCATIGFVPFECSSN